MTTRYETAIVEFQDGTAVFGRNVEWVGTVIEFDDMRGNRQVTSTDAMKRLLPGTTPAQWNEYLKGNLSPVFEAPDAAGVEGAPTPARPQR